MILPDKDRIRREIAASEIIYQRGVRLYEHGCFLCIESDLQEGSFIYQVDGNYGDYTIQIRLLDDDVDTSCDCPYPEEGCKHTVAVLLDVCDRLGNWKPVEPDTSLGEKEYLTPEEIRQQALEDRKKRAKSERFNVTFGEMYKGEHLVETPKGRQYIVTFHHPEQGLGHCTCPDFATNRLNTCKHMIFLRETLKSKPDFKKRINTELFPFVDIFWDSARELPRMFNERPSHELKGMKDLLDEYFDQDGLFKKRNLTEFLFFMNRLNGNKRIRIREIVRRHLEDYLSRQQLSQLAANPLPELPSLNVRLYPYQEEGVRTCLYKPAALIGDEMGLGKTLQAIVLGILKKEIFDFQNILVVTIASLKEQWKREIDRFTNEQAVVVEGNPRQRRTIYETDPSLFKITNYEAVLRDVTTINRFKPDLVVLDEAQRIKNFETKTADAVKRLPRKHALVLTGTPLENKLEDVYSIVQFLDPHLLSPLWQFAADHYMLSRDKKGRILGYRNLGKLQEKLNPLVIRRRKEEVLDDLPDQVVNNYYVDLSQEQAEMHSGYAQQLFPLLNKKFLTPMDIKRIQELLLCMRMVCDSTYLIDRQTHISPKLNELKGIVEEIVLQNNRKTVIFSEWTTMTFLLGKHLSDARVNFVELSGKIPVKKRQALIDEFTNNPDCKVFLSTDAGGTGLNLQAADCVINFELPWNPSRLNQRIGRVNRIGQRSRCVNVINLIAKYSIEEKILAGIQLKADLFEGVFGEGPDQVEFSREKRTELLNKLRELMGEQPEAPIREQRVGEVIPEETPHFLNPEVLGNREEGVIAYDAEETEEPPLEEAEADLDLREDSEGSADVAVAPQSSEKMEAVLNSGIQFLSGLMEMATGMKIEQSGEDERMVRIDPQSGEVTLKFKLPKF